MSEVPATSEPSPLPCSLVYWFYPQSIHSSPKYFVFHFEVSKNDLLPLTVYFSNSDNRTEVLSNLPNRFCSITIPPMQARIGDIMNKQAHRLYIHLSRAPWIPKSIEYSSPTDTQSFPLQERGLQGSWCTHAPESEIIHFTCLKSIFPPYHFLSRFRYFGIKFANCI